MSNKIILKIEVNIPDILDEMSEKGNVSLETLKEKFEKNEMWRSKLINELTQCANAGIEDFCDFNGIMKLAKEN